MAASMVTVPVPKMESSAAPAVLTPVPSGIRTFLASRGSNKGADGFFGGLMLTCALSIIAIVLLIVWVLVMNSRLSLHTFGFGFFVHSDWNPVSGEFGALPFIFGTLVTSFLALCIAVPLAMCVAIFIMEICPKPLRGTVAFLTELLAAIPSVVYGLWAIFVLVPIVRDQLGPFLTKYFGWTGLFSGSNFGEGILTGSIILSIMILPVISSITREVMSAVPISQKEGVLALGATRWEMVRIAVLRNARIGIVGGIILGLGRALGETMAVTMVIGNNPQISKSLFSPGYTLASVIANEFTEATGDLYLSALIEIGLALFLVTIVVNTIARTLVWAVTRNNAAKAH
ncbi:phosphate ABC transporter membrane protein 1, PhoT family [Terriglobus roseus DSM 18391]|uniref:Phosphate transport system permease protein n=1 Tax=Terriglobus roseus (strain DSM 18391 / NRRL B-41598 / KBS 63) TaxID=926566 RepID=I3ZDN5_TERRK|nr:phosphate ABC transporter permease subunit PstC [Terriglobus roseus]AFL87353.1 phosphate ABC transporter membrane protein 1, PhoT family [Terriglobus roseus DSM 18391]